MYRGSCASAVDQRLRQRLHRARISRLRHCSQRFLGRTPTYGQARQCQSLIQRQSRARAHGPRDQLLLLT